MSQALFAILCLLMIFVIGFLVFAIVVMARRLRNPGQFEPVSPPIVSISPELAEKLYWALIEGGLTSRELDVLARNPSDLHTLLNIYWARLQVEEITSS